MSATQSELDQKLKSKPSDIHVCKCECGSGVKDLRCDKLQIDVVHVMCQRNDARAELGRMRSKAHRPACLCHSCAVTPQDHNYDNAEWRCCEYAPEEHGHPYTDESCLALQMDGK